MQKFCIILQVRGLTGGVRGKPFTLLFIFAAISALSYHLHDLYHFHHPHHLHYRSYHQNCRYPSGVFRAKMETWLNQNIATVQPPTHSDIEGLIYCRTHRAPTYPWYSSPPSSSPSSPRSAGKQLLL